MINILARPLIGIISSFVTKVFFAHSLFVVYNFVCCYGIEVISCWLFYSIYGAQCIHSFRKESVWSAIKDSQTHAFACELIHRVTGTTYIYHKETLQFQLCSIAGCKHSANLWNVIAVICTYVYIRLKQSVENNSASARVSMYPTYIEHCAVV